jgi:hypothetical protein
MNRQQTVITNIIDCEKKLKLDSYRRNFGDKRFQIDPAPQNSLKWEKQVNFQIQFCSFLPGNAPPIETLSSPPWKAALPFHQNTERLGTPHHPALSSEHG